MPNFKCAPGYVLVEVLEPSEQKKYTSSLGSNGLSHPSATQVDRLELGRVLVVGEDTDKTTLSPEVGDVIAYQNMASHRLFVSGKEQRLIAKEHCLGAYSEQ